MTRSKLQTQIVTELGGTGPAYTFESPSGADLDHYYLGEKVIMDVDTPATDQFATVDYAGNGVPGDNDYMPAGDYLIIALGATGGEQIDDRPDYLTVEILGFSGTQRHAMTANPPALVGTAQTSYTALVPGLIAYLDTLSGGDTVTFNFQVGTVWGG